MIAKFRIFLAIILTLVCSLITLPLCIISPFNPKIAKIFTRLSCLFVHPILGVNLNRKNYSQLKPNEPGIIISNHQDTLDIWTLSPHFIDAPLAYVGKKSIAWIPFFGQVFYLTGNFFIDRSNKAAAIRTLENAKEIIKKKKKFIWIMPEGTRTGSRGMQEFKAGAFHMAMELKVPIIPIVVSSYHKNINLNLFKPQKVISKMLLPISTDHWNKNNLKQNIENVRLLMLQAQKQLDEELLS